MARKNWDASDFPNDFAKAKHKERSMEHWRACFHIWFWLSGPGSASGPVYTEGGKHWDAIVEQAKAQRDLVRYGWTMKTVNEAHDFAVRNGPATTTPPCTIERDWPETFDKTREEREGMWKDAVSGAHPQMARALVKAQPQVEYLDTTSDVDEWLRS